MAVIARAIRSHRGFEHMYRRHVPSIYRYTWANASIDALRRL